MDKKTVVITGASRRLGLFLTDRFLGDGWSVIAITRTSSESLMQLACNQLTIYELSKYNEKNIINAAEKIKCTTKLVDAIIHNASVYEEDDNHLKDFFLFYQTLFTIHMAMPSLLNLQLAPLLYNDQDPGCIIHITDIYADNPSSKSTLYSSTKAGLDNLTKGLAKKMAPGIRVNSIQPGPIKFLPRHPPADREKILSKTLLPFEGGFLSVYKAIISIIDNNYITGASIKVDGGRSLGDW